MKILWCSDGGVASGFARVAHSIIENLPEDWEIHHLAVNHNGDPYETKKNHKLYPARLGGDLLGINRLQPLIKSLQPDVIFILNDPWVIYDYLTRIPIESKVVAYTPVDAECMDKAWVDNIAKINQLITYTEFGKEEFVKVNKNFDNIKVIPHGTDITKFYPLDKVESKEKLGIDPKLFVVFNGNRNQPRKRVDLTIKAFAKFAKDKPDVRLYLHMGMIDAGWDVEKLCKRYGIIEKLIMTGKNISPSTYVPDNQLNLIYNAADVGLNTSMGEGWGLCNIEQACCKVPQIVPNYSATKEIFASDEAFHINIERVEPHLGILTEGCIIDVDHAAELLERVYQNRELAAETAERAYNKFTQEKYTWAAVAKQFEQVFLEVNKQEPKAKILAEQNTQES